MLYYAKPVYLTAVISRVCYLFAHAKRMSKKNYQFFILHTYLMVKRIMIFFTLVLLGVNGLNAQCDSIAFDVLRLELQPDEYWQEVSWKVSALSNGSPFGSGMCLNQDSVSQEFCIPKGVCTEFRIKDSYGDGIAPDGFYKLFLNDSLIFENLDGVYTYSQTFTFNCPPGTSCGSAEAIAEGEHFTLPDGSQTWFDFTPTQNGVYQLSTCDTSNHCPTKIWVYDNNCEQITVTNNNLGTVFYNEGGCAGGVLAEANLFLAGGHTYHLRIGYGSGNCNGTPVKFSLTFAGAITGCTDSTACNYEPLASISGDCVYPGDPECPNAPDLIVLQQPLLNTISLGSLNNTDACFIAEGCLRGFGQRALIEFTTHIQNIGNEDYFIGETPNDPNAPTDQFVWDPCHNHWHYRGYAEYVLFDAAGNNVPVGSKNGFCVLDLECDNGGAGKYTCENMGITADCGDIYDIGLPCQWIDITELAAGTYTFVVRVNWDKSPDKAGRYEKSYENNWAQACFTLTYGSNGAPDVEFISDCPIFTDCTGEVFGNATPDCEGVCDGPSLIGDWNKNLVREMSDVDAYLISSLTDTTALNNCSEIFNDGHYDVFDAALLQECVLYENDPQHWGTRFPCQFPTGSQNPADLVYFKAGTLDTLAKTFDVKIVNPTNKILGYELEISGLVIDSIENLMPGFEAVFSHHDHRIIALSRNEKPIKKNTIAANLFRVHYSAITSTTVCIDTVIAAVNEKYIKSNAITSEPSCVTVIVSGNNEPAAGVIQMLLLPNPASDQTTLYYTNPRGLKSNIEISDMQGRVVRRYVGLRDNELPIPRSGMPSGIYQIKVSNEEGTAVGRIVWQ